MLFKKIFLFQQKKKKKRGEIYYSYKRRKYDLLNYWIITLQLFRRWRMWDSPCSYKACALLRVTHDVAQLMTCVTPPISRTFLFLPIDSWHVIHLFKKLVQHRSWMTDSTRKYIASCIWIVQKNKRVMHPISSTCMHQLILIMNII